MRGFVFLFLVMGFVAGVAAQPEQLPPDRYGLPINLKLYPQSDPKTTLETASKLLDGQRYDYLLAHILDPEFVDARVADRAKGLELVVDREFQALRVEQQRTLERQERDRLLPLDPKEFGARVQEEATRRAFKLVLKDVQGNLAEYPENVKLFRKFVREGVLNDMGGTASYSLKDLPGKQIYLKREGKRWFLEDRQQEAPTPIPAPVPKSDK